MAELKEHSWLLLLLFLLLIAKFIIVPVYQWQDIQLNDIALLVKKQEKVSAVLDNKVNTIKLKSDIEKILQQVDGLILPFQDVAKFKLDQQKTLELLMNKHELTIQHVGWQLSRSNSDPLFTKHPLLIRFNGRTVDVIKFLAAVEINPQRISVEEFNFSFEGQNVNSLGEITGSVTLMLFMKKALNPKAVLHYSLQSKSEITQLTTYDLALAFNRFKSGSEYVNRS